MGGRPSHARAERTSPLTVARALLMLLGGVSPAAGQNNVFANRAALLVARDAGHEPQHASASHGRELQSSGSVIAVVCSNVKQVTVPAIAGHVCPTATGLAP